MALIFIDLDNTLLYNGKPAPKAILTVELLKENNHQVVIATGRNPNLIYGVDKVFGIDSLVLANGSYVKIAGKVIKEKYIDNSVVKRMMDLADEMKFDFVIEYFDEYISYRKDTEASDKFSKMYNLEIARLDRNFYPDRKVFAMVMFEKTVVDKIKTLFPELQFNQSSHFGFDINPSGKLKAEGIKTVIEYLNYDSDEIYAIGDNFNDITMLEAVKHGIAMGNATEELKKVASYVTTDVCDAGVYNAMKYYKLI